MTSETKRLLKNIFTLGSGKVVAQLITFSFYPILTRLYSPSAFGVWSVFCGIVIIFIPLSNLGVEKAMMVASKDDDALDLFRIGILLTFFWVVTLAIATFTPLAEVSYLVRNGCRPYVWYIPFFLFLNSSGILIFQWGNRQAYYKKLSVGTFGNSLFISIANLCFSFFDKAGGVLLGNIWGRIPILVYWVRHFSLLSILQKKAIRWSVLKDFKDFFRYGFISSTFITLTRHLPALILAYYWDPAVAGFFMLADKILAIPASFVGEATYCVYFQDGAQTDTKIQLWGKTKEIILGLGFVGIVPTVLLLLFAPQLFGLVFGYSWIEAGEYAQILALLYFVNFVICPILPYFLIIRRVKVEAFMSILYTTFQIGGLVLGIGSGVKIALLGMCVGGIIAQLLTVFIAFYITRMTALNCEK